MAPLDSWTYRKTITITGGTGPGADYQVPFFVGESAGAAGYDFHVEGHSQVFPSAIDDSGDIRFVDNDAATLLDVWVESVTGITPNRTAKVWVKVDDSLESNVDIFCYYGNAGASNVSDGASTFITYDDFTSDPGISHLGVRTYDIGFSFPASNVYKLGMVYEMTDESQDANAVRTVFMVPDELSKGDNYFVIDVDSDIAGTQPSIRVFDTITWAGPLSEDTVDVIIFSRDEEDLKVYINDVFQKGSSDGDSDNYTRFRFDLYSGGNEHSDVTYDGVNDMVTVHNHRTDTGALLNIDIHYLFIAKFAATEPGYSSASAEGLVSGIPGGLYGSNWPYGQSLYKDDGQGSLLPRHELAMRKLSPLRGLKDDDQFQENFEVMGHHLDICEDFGKDLLVELFADGAEQLLPYYETTYGLVTDPADSDLNRQNRILTAMRAKGKLNLIDLQALGNTLGDGDYTVVLTEGTGVIGFIVATYSQNTSPKGPATILPGAIYSAPFGESPYQITVTVTGVVEALGLERLYERLKPAWTEFIYTYVP